LPIHSPNYRFGGRNESDLALAYGELGRFGAMPDLMKGIAMLVVTTNDIPGFRIVRHLGLVRGLTVRSRSVVGNIGAAIQIFFGGNISVYTRLAEHTRQEAFDLLVEHAQSMGANAVIAMRYDANEIAAAVTEVLAYGSAVVIEPVPGSGETRSDAAGPWTASPTSR
jgi:uncharacterized protein YbjQ (UPF0145 family)